MLWTAWTYSPGELQERKISANHLLRTTKPHVYYQIVLKSVGRCENARGIREKKIKNDELNIKLIYNKT
jgi:hypothetical protein